MITYKTFSVESQKIIFSDLSVIQKKNEWEILKNKVKNNSYHSRHIIKLIEILNSNINASILDHGCGSCSTLLYLFCLGYKDIWGVDVSCEEKKINFFLKNICDVKEERIFNLQDSKLNFEDNKFDLIISQQVLEHVKYDQKLIMIEEQSRVMKRGAFAYYQIPHILVPYEGHTKTWLIHWLPRKIAIFLYKIFGKNFIFFKDHLFLSFPSTYKRILKDKIGTISDLSFERIITFSNEFKELTGISLFMRIFIVRICRLPILGNFFKKILVNFIMLELLVKKC